MASQPAESLTSLLARLLKARFSALYLPSLLRTLLKEPIRLRSGTFNMAPFAIVASASQDSSSSFDRCVRENEELAHQVYHSIIDALVSLHRSNIQVSILLTPSGVGISLSDSLPESLLDSSTSSHQSIPVSLLEGFLIIIICLAHVTASLVISRTSLTSLPVLDSRTQAALVALDARLPEEAFRSTSRQLFAMIARGTVDPSHLRTSFLKTGQPTAWWKCELEQREGASSCVAFAEGEEMDACGRVSVFACIPGSSLIY